jgi:hypothetical protein
VEEELVISEPSPETDETPLLDVELSWLSITIAALPDEVPV